MLALTSKSKYGMAALMELASHHGNGLLQIKDVAEHQSIPQNYLVQVMNGLVKAGLVRTVRGKNGGYALSKAPDRIALFDVLEALEGPLELKSSGPRHRAMKEILAQAEKGLRETLSISVADLLLLQRDAGEDWGFQI
jgi:Rrf2 family protein